MNPAFHPFPPAMQQYCTKGWWKLKYYQGVKWQSLHEIVRADYPHPRDAAYQIMLYFSEGDPTRKLAKGSHITVPSLDRDMGETFSLCGWEIGTACAVGLCQWYNFSCNEHEQIHWEHRACPEVPDDVLKMWPDKDAPPTRPGPFWYTGLRPPSWAKQWDESSMAMRANKSQM